MGKIDWISTDIAYPPLGNGSGKILLYCEVWLDFKEGIVVCDPNPDGMDTVGYFKAVFIAIEPCSIGDKDRDYSWTIKNVLFQDIYSACDCDNKRNCDFALLELIKYKLSIEKIQSLTDEKLKGYKYYFEDIKKWAFFK